MFQDPELLRSGVEPRSWPRENCLEMGAENRLVNAWPSGACFEDG